MIKKLQKYNELDLKIWRRIKTYVWQHRYAFYMLVALGISTYILMQLPYFNLFLTPVMFFSFLLLASSFLLKIKGVLLLQFVLYLFIIMLLLTLLGKEDAANSFGIFTYITLITAVVILIKEFISEKKR